jgi:hypothetical protein
MQLLPKRSDSFWQGLRVLWILKAHLDVLGVVGGGGPSAGSGVGTRSLQAVVTIDAAVSDMWTAAMAWHGESAAGGSKPTARPPIKCVPGHSPLRLLVPHCPQCKHRPTCPTWQPLHPS